MQGFFDEEAEDDDADEEEDEEEPEEGYEQILKEQASDERESMRDLHKNRALFNKLDRENDEEDLAAYFKQKYSSRNAENNRFGSSDQLSDTIIQQQLLPKFE